MERDSRTLILLSAAALALAAPAAAQAPTGTPTPASAPAAAARFVDVTAHAGVAFTHDNGAFGQKWMPESIGAGVVIFDADGDGRLDLFFVNGRSFPGKPGTASTQRLYRNLGGLKFEDATARHGLDVSAYCFGGAAGDLDNDGDPDLYLACLGQDLLLRNDEGRFTEVGKQAGLVQTYEHGASVALFDADRDGLLDVLATRYIIWTPETDAFCALDGKTKAYCTPQTYQGAASRYYRNKGGLTFEDRTRQAGLFNDTAKTMGVTILDLEGDGAMDVALANDTTPNLLYQNDGKGGFTEVGAASGMALSETGGARGGMGIDAGDFNRSGRPSLAIGYFSGEPMGLYRNEGNHLFMDIAPLSDVGKNTRQTVGWSTFFFDYDLDGWLDLFVANGHLDEEWQRVQARVRFAQPQQLFRNAGKGRFVEVTESVGGDLATPVVGRGAAFGDLDEDGDLDVVVTTMGGPAKVFENRGQGYGNWLRVALEGTQSNRDGLGAEVQVTAGGAIQKWLVRAASGYLSQSQVDPTFGLGAATAAEKVVVRWPSGAVSTLENVKANQRIEVKEPAAAKAK